MTEMELGTRINMFRGVVLAFFMMVTSFTIAQNSTIRGVLIDEAGDFVPFCVVVVDDGEYSAMTDLDGAFSISLPAGRYKITADDGTKKVVVEGVVALAGQVKVLGTLKMETTSEVVDEVVINIEKNTTKTESAVQKKIEKAVVVKSGTSKEQMKKTQDSDAGAAAKRIPGISIVGGKYVFVRGIGDRYNKTTINGVDVPGLDPDRNSIQMDLFPTSIIDNIIISKSMSADLPANFAGGVIDLGLKDFPDKMESSFSVSSSYNPNMHFNSDYLTYQGGPLDFIGLAGSDRDVPTGVVTENDLLTAGANFNNVQADYNDFIEQFDNQMAAAKATSLMDFSLSGGHGNQLSLKNKGSFGYNFATSYSNKTRFYEGAEFGEYGLSGAKDSLDLERRNKQVGSIASNNVLFSAMGGVAYKKGSNKVKLNVLRIQNGVKRAGIFDFEKDDQGNDFIGKKFTLGFNERILNNLILEGDHQFGIKKDSAGNKVGKPNWQLVWKLAPTIATINDPDIRSVNYELENGSYFTNSNVGFPSRIWREMSETTLAGRLDLTRKLKNKQNIKFGGASTYKFRDFSIKNFLVEGTIDDLTGDGNEVWSDGAIWDGSIATSGGDIYKIKPDFVPEETNAYTARSLYNAGYISTQLVLGKKLKSVMGVRVEKFDQWYSGKYKDVSGPIVELKDSLVLSDFDFFPSINMIYALNENENNRQNLRLSASRTIARPSMKEKSYAIIIDPFTGRTFNGGLWPAVNSANEQIWDGDLISTDITNLDFRWEAFSKLAQTVSLSGFYKNFQNPIEIVQSEKADNNIQPQNVGTGNLYGAEFDLRRRLTFLDSTLLNWAFNVNVTYTYSQIKMSDTEYNSKVANAREGQEISEFRAMAGQAPYLINGGISYLGGLKDSTKWKGVQAGFFYNVQGRTLQVVGIADKPDVYTKPFHSLNFTASKTIEKRDSIGDVKFTHTFGIKASNILNDVRESIYDAYGTDQEYFFSRLAPGMAFKVRYGLKF